MKIDFRVALAAGLILGSILVWPVTQCRAQATDGASAKRAFSDSELDALLEANDWKGLHEALARAPSQEAFVHELDWLKKRVGAGGGLVPTVILARTLWAVGTKLNVADPKQDPRISSALLSLYILALITIDGEKCEDRSAPVEHLRAELTGNAEAIKFLKQQSPEMKKALVDSAVGLEKQTSPVRKNDIAVCSGGVAQMKAGLERGQMSSQSQVPGLPGKTVDVTPPADWKPTFLAAAIYEPKQNKSRETLRESLLKFVN